MKGLIEMKNNAEYILSVHLLKKLVGANLISYKEYEAIDQLNRKRFLRSENSVKTAE